MSKIINQIVELWPKKASVTYWKPSFDGGVSGAGSGDAGVACNIGHAGNVDISKENNRIYDYPISTLPVDQNDFVKLPEDLKKSLSTSFWIQYNRRTIDAEDYIANPAIDYILRDIELPHKLKVALMQTAVDERYHTYFHTLALEEALQRSNVAAKFTRSVTVREMNQRLEECSESWKKNLVQIAYATVAEISVNAFLEILSTSKEIHAANRTLVFMHNMDEGFHSQIFVEVVKHLTKVLPFSEANFLVNEIKAAGDSFLKHDFSMYENVFKAHDVKLDLRRDKTMMTRNMSGIERLIKEFKEFEKA